jgi:hypothetical protein
LGEKTLSANFELLQQQLRTPEEIKRKIDGEPLLRNLLEGKEIHGYGDEIVEVGRGIIDCYNLLRQLQDKVENI